MIPISTRTFERLETFKTERLDTLGNPVIETDRRRIACVETFGPDGSHTKTVTKTDERSVTYIPIRRLDITV